MKIQTLFLAFLLLFSVACDFSRDNPVAPEMPDPPVTPYSVTAAGTCVASGTSVQCTDRSACLHPTFEDVCRDILWELTNSGTGFETGSEVGAHLASIQFDGLAAGQYSLEQTATAPDGVSNKAPHNVTVTGR